MNRHFISAIFHQWETTIMRPMLAMRARLAAWRWRRATLRALRRRSRE